MFQVQNTRTGRFVGDAITGKTRNFEKLEVAQKWADNMHRNSCLNATAWNSVRPSVYKVVSA